MTQQLGAFSYLVRDYDEAIAFFVDAMGFDLLEDTTMSPVKRWVRVAPRGSVGACMVLARADKPEQVARIGDQSGGRVWMFLNTDDYHADRARMEAAGIRFVEATREEPYATVAVFEDLYGNRWDLIQPR